jgi:hypothetical protein
VAEIQADEVSAPASRRLPPGVERAAIRDAEFGGLAVGGRQSAEATLETHGRSGQGQLVPA